MIGNHIARAVGYVYGTASTGTEQIGVNLEIVGDDDPYVGQNIVWYGYFSEKAAENTIANLRTLGWSGEDMMALKEEGLGSVEVEIVVGKKIYNHKESFCVEFINPLGSNGIRMKSQMADSGKRSLAERMKAHVLATKPVGGPRATY